MTTISRKARQQALVARHHLDGRASRVTQVLDDLVAMHSSDPITPHLGLWARVRDYQTTHLEAAMPAPWTYTRRPSWRV